MTISLTNTETHAAAINQDYSDFSITGMRCSSCVARVEQSIKSLPNVESATVNLLTKSAHVTWKTGVQLDSPQVVAAVAKVGYQATEILRNETTSQETSPLISFNQENQEKEDSLHRTKISAVFTLPLMVLNMAPMVGIPLPRAFDPDYSPSQFAWIQFAFTVPVLWIGRQFYQFGFRALLKLSPTMDSLVAVGTLAAASYSFVNTTLATFGRTDLVHHLYYETAAVIISLILFGRYLESKSKARASDAVKSLYQLQPDTAIRLHDDQETVIPVHEIQKGDILLVKPGMRIATDGIVVRGHSSVDESMLTGESIPTAKSAGDDVTGATINQLGTIQMRAEKIGQDTVLAQIVRLVANAQASKAPIADFADRISLYFVPVVMAIAVGAALLWAAAGADTSFTLTVFVAVLIIACPCALGLATPTAVLVGTGRGAQLGILFKGGAAIEAASRIQTVLFDKTGTLTTGEPEVTDIILLGKMQREDVLKIAASLESLSEHPLAKAIINEFRKYSSTPCESIANFQAIPGEGVAGELDGKLAYFGNKKLIQRIAPGTLIPDSDQDGLLEGKTSMFLMLADELLAIIAVADQVRPESAAAVNCLKSLGYEVAMVTGDSQTVARSIGNKLQISKIFAEIPPGGKAEIVKNLQQTRKNVAMIGDGINDAPALAQADLGIAMGTGSDIAKETGDIVIIKPHLFGVINALRLGNSTLSNIKQNLFWAFIYNILGIPIAAGILHVFGGPILSPMFAAGAMAISSVSVVTNAIRLKLFQPLTHDNN